MDCAQIRQEFLTGNVPSGAAVAEHVKWCPQCAELFRHGAALGRRLALAAVGGPRDVSSELAATESLLGREHGLRAYLRSRSTRVRWALVLSVPLLLLVREAARGRVPLAQLGSARLVMGAVLLVALAVIAQSALRPRALTRATAQRRSVLAMVAWCLPCMLFFAPETRSLHVDDWSSGLSRGSLSCFTYGSALAAPSFALLWAFDRDPQLSLRVWALAAGMVAVAANLILLLHCANTQAGHLLTGHFAIGLAWFGLAAVAGRWTQRAR